MHIVHKLFLSLILLPFCVQAQNCEQAMAHDGKYKETRMKILTIFDDHSHCLARKADPISLTPKGLQEAHDIAQQLLATLKPLMPAAGLAAPQIGISQQVFIFSWDRTWENMTVAINPKIISRDSDLLGWESCFSAMQKEGISQAVYVARAKDIVVEYTTLEGERVRYHLVGFAAKVFQHEYDHLQGIVDTQKEGAVVKTFHSHQDLVTFMTNVKKEDSWGYIQPTEMPL